MAERLAYARGKLHLTFGTVFRESMRMAEILDLFDNPVGCRTSLRKILRILLFYSGSCSETEVSEQLYFVEVSLPLAWLEAFGDVYFYCISGLFYHIKTVF